MTHIKIATDIDDELFYDIKEFLENDGWHIVNEYPLIFDKGIDVDYYVLTKHGQTIFMHWDIYFKGEIKAEQQLFDVIAQNMGCVFVFGQPVNLNDSNQT